MIQLQGGGIFPCNTTAATWFLKNVLSDKFNSLAKSKKYAIKNFNEALSKVSHAHPLSRDVCGFCSFPLDLRARPVTCDNCLLKFHKSTNCLRRHDCSSGVTAQIVEASVSDPSHSSSMVDVGNNDSIPAPLLC